MDIDMSQFYQVFFDETEELLAEKERLLLEINLEDPDMEDINAIFRCAHSIKGGAATFGLTDMTEVTHILESLLDKIRKKEIALTAEHVDAFLVAKDVLMMLKDGHRNGSPVDQDAVASVMARLKLLSDKAEQQSSAAAPATPAAMAVPAPKQAPTQASTQQAAGGRSIRIELPDVPQKDVDALAVEMELLGTLERTRLENGHQAFILTTAESMDDILAICSFVLDPKDLKISEETSSSATDVPSVSALPDASDDHAEGKGYGFFDQVGQTTQVPDASHETIATATSLPSVANGTNSTSQGTSAPKPHAKQSPEKMVSGHDSSSIRVSVEKVDQLINLVGELVITQAMIEQRSGILDPMLHERLLSSVSQLNRNTRDLQEAVMSIRMMPMDYVFSRFPRMVRDLAGKLGKKIEFITHGAATELDKGLIERITDPLTHLVRNSVDHGIETPDIRAAAGKSESGKLTLSAAHQGGNIVIEVSDDGGGLNREKILAKAAQNGLPVSDNMPDNEVWQLIFAPGFSTAEKVTDVSGRGVGMDVVRRNITAMGGIVDIRSVQSKGTTISISLPLTLAILDGMSIKVGDEIYILPLGYVIESLKPLRNDVKEITGQGRVVKVRGEYLPLIPLYELFNIQPRYTEPSDGMVVILETDGNKAALFIDEMLGQQQVVVKNLESNYRKVAGISGATILGDGGVALILDVSAIVRSSRSQSLEKAFA
ncbi:MAG: chemotaxis protein CheA [Burkholderiaceae bacterium]|nr:chemotaxis protein CheA [Burkholderiaceae bacterium]